MTLNSSTLRAALLAFGLSLFAHGAAFADAAVLTVTGAVSQPNRGAYDADTDKFFGYSEVTFDAARSFGHADLAALTNVTITADFPKGAAVHSFTGPTLADVLAAAGATGTTITIQALDGYAVEAPFSEMIAQGAVVATSRDGAPFGLGGFGPTQIVFPRAMRADLKDMSDDRWVWSIFHIRVE